MSAERFRDSDSADAQIVLLIYYVKRHPVFRGAVLFLGLDSYLHWKLPIMGPTHPGPSGQAGELQTYIEHVAPYVEHAVVQLLFTPEHSVG